MSDRDPRDMSMTPDSHPEHFGKEDGHSDRDDDLQKVKEERDSYQQAAVVSEQNELLLFRQIWEYQQQELEQLRGEVQMWRRKAEEGAREVLDEQEVSGDR